MIVISYNDSLVFNGIAGTPFASIGVRPVDQNGKYGLIETITLQGQITGSDCGSANYFSGLYDKQEQLIQSFNTQYKPFRILEEIPVSGSGQSYWAWQLSGSGIEPSYLDPLFPNQAFEYDNLIDKNLQARSPLQSGAFFNVVSGNLVPRTYAEITGLLSSVSTSGALTSTTGYRDIYHAPYAYIRNFSFGESKYFGIVPFTITLDLYQNEQFVDNGVLDPVDRFDFSEDLNCNHRMTHTMSARGFNTNINAFDNAKSYVQSKSGWNGQVTPLYVEDPDNMTLLSRVESSNRLAGEYSLVEEYIYSSRNLATTGYLEYERNVTSKDNEVTVSVQGTIRGGIDYGIPALRTQLSGISFYNIAQSGYAEYYTGTLKSKPITFSVTENVQENNVSFGISYSDRINGDIYIVDQTTINRNYLNGQNCIILANQIYSSEDCKSTRFNKIKSFYETGVNVTEELSNAWNQYTSGIKGYIFGTSYREDPFTPVIGYGATQCNDRGDEGLCLENITYSISCSPSIPVYKSTPVPDGTGCHCIWNLEFNKRARLNINLNAKLKECCSQAAAECETKTLLDRIANQYLEGANKILETVSVSFGENGSTSASATWTSEGNIFTLP